jgi:hypothetical protein
MALHGLVADHQLGRDTAVRQPADHVRQYLAFPLRQAVAGARPELVALDARGGVDGARRHAGVDRCFTAVNELELTDELVAADALEQITRGADPHRLKEVLLIVVHRQHDDLPVRVTFTQRLAQIKPAAALHAHVAEHDVRVQLLDHLERALGAHCLADNAHPVGERGQHCLEALDHHLVVVDQHDSH